MWIRKVVLAALLLLALGFSASCSGSLDPVLGARLILEEQITDNVKAQVILGDDDLLQLGSDKDDDDEDEYWYWDGC